MPVFREFWGWAVFGVLALAGLLIAVVETEWNGFGGYVIDVGRKVQPLWISAAILVYTVTEGIVMLAEAFKRKLHAKYRAEGVAEGEVRGVDNMQAAVRQVAERRGMDPEATQRLIEEAREIVRNGRAE